MAALRNFFKETTSKDDRIVCYHFTDRHRVFCYKKESVAIEILPGIIKQYSFKVYVPAIVNSENQTIVGDVVQEGDADG